MPEVGYHEDPWQLIVEVGWPSTYIVLEAAIALTQDFHPLVQGIPVTHEPEPPNAHFQPLKFLKWAYPPSTLFNLGFGIIIASRYRPRTQGWVDLDEGDLTDLTGFPDVNVQVNFGRGQYSWDATGDFAAQGTMEPISTDELPEKYPEYSGQRFREIATLNARGGAPSSSGGGVTYSEPYDPNQPPPPGSTGPETFFHGPFVDGLITASVNLSGARMKYKGKWYVARGLIGPEPATYPDPSVPLDSTTVRGWKLLFEREQED